MRGEAKASTHPQAQDVNSRLFMTFVGFRV